MVEFERKNPMEVVTNVVVHSYNACKRYGFTRNVFLFIGLWFTHYLSIRTIRSCRFMYDGDTDVGIFRNSYVDPLDGTFLGCIKPFGKQHIDSMMKASQTMTILSFLFNMIAVYGCTLVFVGCPKRLHPHILWTISSYSLAGGTISQMFTFLALGSKRCGDVGCSLSRFGIISVLNTLLLAFLSIVIFRLRPPTRQTWILRWNKEYENTNDEQQMVPETSEEDEEQQQQHPSNGKVNNHHHPLAVIHEVDSLDTEIDMSKASSYNNTSSSLVLPTTTFLLNVFTIQKSKLFRLTIVGLITLSWFMSMTALRKCTFLVIEKKNYMNDGVDSALSSSSSFTALGLFRQPIEIQGQILGCVSFSNEIRDDMDGIFRTGRFFGTLSTLVLTFIFIISIHQLFANKMSILHWKLTKYLLPFVACTNVLSFVAFGTGACTTTTTTNNNNYSGTCHVGRTGILVIINLLLMIFLSICYYFIPPPQSPLFSFTEEEILPNILFQYLCCFFVKDSDLDDVVMDTKTTNHLEETSCMYDDDDDDSIEDEDEEENCVENTACRRYLTDVPAPVEKMSVHVLFKGDEKTTIKTLTHSDGSQTVKMIVENVLADDSESVVSEYD